MDTPQKPPAPTFAQYLQATALEYVEPDQPTRPSMDSKTDQQRKEDLEDAGPLDLQYLNIVSTIRTLQQQVRDRLHSDGISTENNETIHLLQRSLVDLQVWAYDLSGDTEDFLGFLRQFSENTSSDLRQILADISGLLIGVENDVTSGGGLNSRAEPEWLSERIARLRTLVDDLKRLKPSLKKRIALWKTKDDLSSPAQAAIQYPPTVLCLDGGGVKSYSSLLVLGELMKYISEEVARRPNESLHRTLKKPSEVFDLMFGSSSGGLIAIMLGRLEMTLEESMLQFCGYADTIFAHPKLRTRLRRVFKSSKYDGNTITQATKRLVHDFDPTPAQEKWRRDEFSARHGSCKTGVLATHVLPSATSYVFRTYDCKNLTSQNPLRETSSDSDSASTCRIWEVACATSAAPTFFRPVQLDAKVFVDGGVTANNPTQEALKDVTSLYGKLAGACVVSIGSGVSRDRSASERVVTGKKGRFGSFKTTIQLLRSVATETELTDTQIHWINESVETGFKYFRFNVTYDEPIALDEWNKSDATRTKILMATKAYLGTEEISKRLYQCAHTIVEKVINPAKMLAEDTPVRPLQRNVHFYVPRMANALFVGRQDVLNYIEQRLNSSEHEDIPQAKVITITGMGGQGKSEVCLMLAARMRNKFWGIFWVDVSTSSSAENEFVAIAKRLGSTVQDSSEAVQMLANVDQRWLLILDNADDPNLDIQRFIPPARNGNTIITSRNSDCRDYSTDGTIELEPLSNGEAEELLLKAARMNQGSTSWHYTQAEKIASLLGYHTLAITQAGAYIAAGHCGLDDYPKMYGSHRQRLLSYRRSQGASRYGDLYSTFESSADALRSLGQRGGDALCLVGILSMLDHSHVPFDLFKNAWQGHQMLQQQPATTRITPSLEILGRSIPDFLSADKSIEWDCVRLVEAVSLLASLDLVRRTKDGITMRPLVHSWAKDRQSGEEQVACWVTTGSILALSDHSSTLWYLHQMQLRSHMQSFLEFRDIRKLADEEVSSVWTVLLASGRILAQMQEYTSLASLIMALVESHKPESAESQSSWVLLRNLHAETLLHQGHTSTAVRVLENVTETFATRLSRCDPDRLASLQNLALAYTADKRLDKAELIQAQVVDLSSIAFGPSHANTVGSILYLAVICQRQGRHAKAQGLRIRALEIMKNERFDGSHETIMSAGALARMMQICGQPTDDEDSQRAILTYYQQVFGERHPATVTSMVYLASIYQHKGRYSEAEKLRKESLLLSRRIWGNEASNEFKVIYDGIKTG